MFLETSMEDLNIDGRITLELILGRKVGKIWTGFMWLRIGTSSRPFKHGNEPSGSIRGGEFLD
jgi:hypothetical protein